VIYKKIIFIIILITIGFESFSDEHIENKNLSFNDFVKLLESESNEDLVIENCNIIYNKQSDYKYIKKETYYNIFNWRRFTIEDLNIDRNFYITNCSFLKEIKNIKDGIKIGDGIHFRNCYFKNLRIYNDSLESNNLFEFTNTVIDQFFTATNINEITFDSLYIKGPIEISIIDEELNSSHGELNLINSNVSKVFTKNLKNVYINNSKISHYRAKSDYKAEFYSIIRNNFNYCKNSGSQLWQENENKYVFLNEVGLNIEDLSVEILNFNSNKYDNKYDLKIDNDTAIKYFSNYNKLIKTFQVSDINNVSNFNVSNFSDRILDEFQAEFLDSLFKQKKDSIEIIFQSPFFSINDCEIDQLSLIEDSLEHIELANNFISKKLSILNSNFKDYIKLSNNTFPDFYSIKIDSSVFNLGFLFSKNRYIQGTEDFNEIKDIINKDNYIKNKQNLVSSYRKLIKILDSNGSFLKNKLSYKFKDVETSIKEYEYLQNKNLNNWFSWKGNLFLKIYSDYGNNPFKALTFCFWTILLFGGVFFFFRSDWDNINPNSLRNDIKQIIKYYSSETTIDQIYSENHINEIDEFENFKKILNEAKLEVPNSIRIVSKPVYQFSLTRHKIIKYLYSKFEFMAGKKWKNLENKTKIKIGFISYILIFLYLVYILFVRMLNSLILSINSFSTLGFGQIPVRGFVKYLAIIEGFIGWFLLSVFIVSLLNQIMNT
tara:strand:+ start:10814 stop:12958 length:2145 start_codon:yes stop_codon:yes gene_type:complete